MENTSDVTRFPRMNVKIYYILPRTRCGDIRLRIEILSIKFMLLLLPTTAASTAELEIAGSEIDATADASAAEVKSAFELSEP